MNLSTVRICTNCGAENRIPPKHLAVAGRCGACGSEIAAPNEPIDASPVLLHQIVAGAKVAVMVQFQTASEPQPDLRSLAEAVEGRALVLTMNASAHPSVPLQFGVETVPNFIVFRDGEAIWRGDLAGWLKLAHKTSASAA